MLDIYGLGISIEHEKQERPLIREIKRPLLLANLTAPISDACISLFVNDNARD